jgi:hypothetical protein
MRANLVTAGILSSCLSLSGCGWLQVAQVLASNVQPYDIAVRAPQPHVEQVMHRILHQHGYTAEPTDLARSFRVPDPTKPAFVYSVYLDNDREGITTISARYYNREPSPFAIVDYRGEEQRHVPNRFRRLMKEIKRQAEAPDD